MIVAPLVAAIALSAGAHVQCPGWAQFARQSASIDGRTDRGGVFWYGLRTIVLNPAVCDTLDELAAGRRPGPRTWPAWGWGVYTFAHELQHAAGVTDEATADCGAGRTFLGVAAELRVRRRDAVRLLTVSARIDGYDPSVFMGCVPGLVRSGL